MIMTGGPGVEAGAEVDEMIETVIQGDLTTGLVLLGIRNKIGPVETCFEDFSIEKIMLL